MSHSFPRCFSTLGCPELSLEQCADLAIQFQVPLLEIRTLDNRMDIPARLREFPGGWKGALDYLNSRNLGVRVLGTSFQLTNWNEAGWTELLDFADLAEQLNAPYLRVFGGGQWGPRPTAEGLDAAARLMGLWRDERAARGWKVDLLVETHDAFSSSERCLELIDAIGEPVGILWDTHHTWRMAGEQPEFTWNQLGRFVKHIHFKDSTGTSEKYAYTTPGSGEMPFAEVLKVLEQGEYEGALSLEWEKKWHPELAPMAEALAACGDAGWW